MGAIKDLRFVKRDNDTTYIAPFPEYINHHAISANTAESDTVAPGAKFVMITVDVLTFVNFNTTAAVGTDTTDGTAPLMIPAGSSITVALRSTVTTISMISGSNGHVNLGYYS